MNLNTLYNKGFIPYKFSFRSIDKKIALCIVKKNNEKFICIISNVKNKYSETIFEEKDENSFITIFKLNWDNYQKLKDYTNLKPKKINKKVSIGTGDRTGLISASQIKALSKYDIFPVIVQLTSEEINNTCKTYKDALLNGVMGILESGYQGDWGADANNISNKTSLQEAIDANFSMFTIEINKYIKDLSYIEENIDDLSKNLNTTSLSIIEHWTNKRLFNGEKNIYLNKDNLIYSACLFQEALDNSIKFYKEIKKNIDNFDFEISMNKSPRVTTISDYTYCVNYLTKNNINSFLISPKYDGTFNPSFEYEGNKEDFYKQIYLFKSIINILKNHKLSLHSSDKFSIYNKFKNITDNTYHIKTCGTSWLRVPILCAIHNQDLFNKILEIVNIDNKNIKPENIQHNKELCELLNYNYDIIINKIGNELFDFLKNNEKDLYYLIEKNIDKYF